jgi:hypothetical protein
MSPAGLLAFLLSGARFGDVYSYSGVPAGPSDTIDAYVAALRNNRRLHGVHTFARLVRQQRLHGTLVDVVDFGPLTVLSTDSGGCFATTSGAAGATPVTYPPTGPCIHHHQSLGWGRVYIRHSSPVVLRFEQHGVTSIENVLTESVHYRYDIRSLSAPARVDGLRSYHPPVKVTVMRSLPFVVFGSETDQSAGPIRARGFVEMSEPNVGNTPETFSRLATTYFGIARTRVGSYSSAQPPLPQVPGVDILFAHRPHWTRVRSAWHGQPSIYITGQYVLVQERKLAAGLPRAFTPGRARAADKCPAWTGTYSHGERWIASQKSGVSIVVSSNALSTEELRRYLERTVCSG